MRPPQWPPSWEGDGEGLEAGESSWYEGADEGVAAEMSRLVGRDGYLLPYATNEYHKDQEAQLHHLHHQDPWRHSERRHGYDDRENIFFR